MQDWPTGPSIAPAAPAFWDWADHTHGTRAALLTGGRLEVVDPGESQDIGIDWQDPRALTDTGDREATEAWTWAGPARSVTGRTWGGCVEVLQWLLTAGRFPFDAAVLDGGVLLLESSEEMIPAREFGFIVRSLGERAFLAAVDAVVSPVPRPRITTRARHRMNAGRSEMPSATA
ncbi:MAG: hypothetical protein V9G19_01955 [Tetrasphaera sp.]